MNQFISEQSIYQYFGDDDPEMIKEMIQIILATNINDLKELVADLRTAFESTSTYYWEA